jgi:hypothetical protein
VKQQKKLFLQIRTNKGKPEYPLTAKKVSRNKLDITRKKTPAIGQNRWREFTYQTSKNSISF